MVTARFIRFIPTKWNFGPNARSCMRVEIYECLPVKGINIIYGYAHFRVTVLTSCLKVSYMYCTSILNVVQTSHILDFVVLYFAIIYSHALTFVFFKF